MEAADRTSDTPTVEPNANDFGYTARPLATGESAGDGARMEQPDDLSARPDDVERDTNELGFRNVSEEREYDERGDQGAGAGDEPIAPEQP